MPSNKSLIPNTPASGVAPCDNRDSGDNGEMSDDDLEGVTGGGGPPREQSPASIPSFAPDASTDNDAPSLFV